MQKEFKTTLDKNTKKLVENFYKENLFYRENQLKSKVEEKNKVLKEILVSNEVNIKNKILFMLNKIGLKYLDINDYTSNIIKIRNDVAHGKIVYLDELLFDLPPYFSKMIDSYKECCEMHRFIIYVISFYYNLNSKEELEQEFKRSVTIGKRQILNIIDDLTVDELLYGKKYNCTFQNFFFNYVHSFTEKERETLLKKLRRHFLEIEVNEKTGYLLFEISIIFMESKDKEVLEKARGNVEKIILSGYESWPNKKDIIFYIEHYGLTCKNYKEIVT